MDFSKPVTITSVYLEQEISVEFPSVLDKEMIKEISDLHTKRLNVSRGGKTKIIAFELRVRFFDKMATRIISGITPPEGATGAENWQDYVPAAVKDDMVQQLESATSVTEAETGN